MMSDKKQAMMWLVAAVRGPFQPVQSVGGIFRVVVVPLKNQFGIWRYKFPLQIKLICIICDIFLNFLIIMFYLQENCIQARIPCV